MAHYEKFSKQGVGHIFLHVRRAYKIGEDGRREYVNFGNKDIDTTRSHLNYNLCVNEAGTPPNQRERYEAILAGKTLPDGKELIVNKRKDLKVVCGWVVTIPDDVRPGDDKSFFKAVYKHLLEKYPHCIAAYCHYDECQHGSEKTGCHLKAHMHFLFVPIYFDKKKGAYKISANELVGKKELQSFHDELSETVAKELGYKVSIKTGEFSDKENDRKSVDILKFKVGKLAADYHQIKDRFENEGLQLAADLAKYIVKTGQKDRFADFQEQQKREAENYNRGIER